MAKKLDILLEDIEGEGGFRDASITSQTNSLMELEEGVWALSDRCRIQRVCSICCLIFVVSLCLLALPYNDTTAKSSINLCVSE